MRVLALLLLALPTAGEEILFKETRAWRGEVEVRSLSREPVDGKGREEQEESVEFVLVSQPPRTPAEARRLPFEMRQSEGSWRLRIDRTEEQVVTRGERAGRLHVRVRGHVDPTPGRCALLVTVAPGTLIAKATMSGMDRGRFQTFRTVVSRPPFLASFRIEGTLEEGGRLLRGSRSFTDRGAKYPRDVTVSWRLRRVDPVIAGRVVDHRGVPVPDIEVLARTTNPARARNRLPPVIARARTDANGRFAIPAYWATWGIEVVGRVRDGVVVAGRVLADGVTMRFDSNPELELEVEAFRLARLPDSHLLKRHFRGDVRGYLDHVRPRAGEARMRRALLVAPPAQR